jgi:hypothetical protein
MASPFDKAEFIDHDLPDSQPPRTASALPSVPAVTPITGRPPTREELEARASETQSRIAALRRAQEELERERSKVEEARRRRTEFETGRGEMRQHLTRGVGLLEQAEFKARRDADQMAKTLADFKEALANVEAIQEAHWTPENWEQELTRALTTIENARMEWSSARLKFTVLDGEAGAAGTPAPVNGETPTAGWFGERTFFGLCRLGFALTWPLALVALIAIAVLGVAMWRH